MGNSSASKVTPRIRHCKSSRPLTELDLISFYRSYEGHYLRESFVQYLNSKPSFLKKYFFLYEVLIELYHQGEYSKYSFLHIAIFLNEHAIDKYMKTMTVYLSADSINMLTAMKQSHQIDLSQLNSILMEITSYFTDILISFQQLNLFLQYEVFSDREIRKKKLLIVAKSSPFTHILKKLLPLSCYDTVHISNPYDALADLQMIPYEVVLIERSLEDIDPMSFHQGYLEVEYRVQSKFIDYRKPQFVLLSNEEDSASIESFIDAGFRGVLPIPFELSLLYPLSEPEPLLDSFHRSLKKFIPKSNVNLLSKQMSAGLSRKEIKTIVD